ncbi:hypothetical protein BDZ88DRAFT_246568 [Geranomyces variabilis]|nr:hypothetical protein BDZ88DRAFT_246568 [Geranomyces variabilis]
MRGCAFHLILSLQVEYSQVFALAILSSPLFFGHFHKLAKCPFLSRAPHNLVASRRPILASAGIRRHRGRGDDFGSWCRRAWSRALRIAIQLGRTEIEEVTQRSMQRGLSKVLHPNPFLRSRMADDAELDGYGPNYSKDDNPKYHPAITGCRSSLRNR